MGTWTHTLHQETHSDSSAQKRREEQSSSQNLQEVFSCSQVNCPCECFQPGRGHIRSCDRCTHGWVTHAVSKVCVQAAVCSGQVEIVQSNVVFDISSLILYGTHALPVRMKILLDRLFSVLTHTQVLSIIHTLGWTLRDYVRGYMLQDSVGRVLDRWVIMSAEDEAVTLQQFLRFGETKSIVELMSVQVPPETPCKAASNDSDICVFSESGGLHHFENLPFLQPFQYIGAAAAPRFPPSPSILSDPPAEPQEPRPVRVQRQNNRRTDSVSLSQLRRDDKPRAETRRQTAEIHPPSSQKHSRAEERAGDVDARVPRMRGESVRNSSSAGVRRSGSSLCKDRVSCSACAKTFYDKGTLKIHYNAVHLKIKHRCIVEGCNMMFSSLRSRNRHSANPNPRLHSSAQHTSRTSTHTCTHPLTSRPATRLHSTSPNTHPHNTSTSPVTTHPSVSHTTNNTDQQETDTGGGATRTTANQNGLNKAIDIIIPKKKPRKSSMPLKFERERSCSEDDEDQSSGANEMINNRFILSQRQSVSSLHGNKHHTHINPIGYGTLNHDCHSGEIYYTHVNMSSVANHHKQHRSRHLHETPGSSCWGYCSYHSNSIAKEQKVWMKEEILGGVEDEWRERHEPPLKVKKEASENRDHHHGNM